MCVCGADVRDWLKAVGHDYDSLVPAVSYGGLVGAHAEDRCAQPRGDDVTVTSSPRCAYAGHAARFAHLPTVTASLVTAGAAALPPPLTVASSPSLLGPGFLLSVDDSDDQVAYRPALPVHSISLLAV